MEKHTLFDIHGNNKSSNVLFATLTYNTRRSMIQETWKTVDEEFNKWIRNLRKSLDVSHTFAVEKLHEKAIPHTRIVGLSQSYVWDCFLQIKER
jgi:hypothetical protein